MSLSLKIKGFYFIGILLLTCSFLMACKKNKKKTEELVNPTLPVVIVVPPPVAEVKKLLPVLLEDGKNTIEFTYIDKSALISEIRYSDGRKEVFTYNSSKQILAHRKYNQEVLNSLMDYFMNASGQVLRAAHSNVVANKYTPTGYSLFEYNSNSQPINLKYYDNLRKIVKEEVREYNSANDLLTTKTTAEAMAPHVITNNYDAKHGVFKHLLNLPLLQIEATDGLFISGNNNVLSVLKTSAGSVNQYFSYTYNADEYPATYTFTEGTVKKTYKITYKLLE
jgi:hypothetical protein